MPDFTNVSRKTVDVLSQMTAQGLFSKASHGEFAVHYWRSLFGYRQHDTAWCPALAVEFGTCIIAGVTQEMSWNPRKQLFLGGGASFNPSSLFDAMLQGARNVAFSLILVIYFLLQPLLMKPRPSCSVVCSLSCWYSADTERCKHSCDLKMASVT